MKNYTVHRILIILILLLFAGVSQAQKDNGRKQFRNEIEKVMKQKLMDSLNLDEATADKFIAANKESNKSIKVLLKEKKDIQQSIELDPGAVDIESKLDKYMEIDSMISDARINYYKELKTFLTPEQIAKSMIIKKKFGNELKKQLKKRKNQDKFNGQNEGLK